MQFDITYSNLTNLSIYPWSKRIGPTINPVPATDLEIFQASDGSLCVTNDSSQDEGGAMAALALDIPADIAKCSYVGFDIDYFIPDFCIDKLEQNEIDVKLPLFAAAGNNATAQNMANGSTQWDSLSGCWEFDSTGTSWVSSGYKCSRPPANTWLTYSMRMQLFAAAKGYSLLSLTDGVNPKFMLPPAAKNLPLLSSTWTQIGIQLQTEVAGPASVTIKYRNGVLRFSSNPF